MNKNFEITGINAIKLGKYISKRRAELGYSTNHIQIHSGIDKADLSRIENAKKKRINPMQLKALADVLKMSQVELFEIAGFLDTDNEAKFDNKSRKANIDLNNPITEFKQIPIYDSISAGFGSCESCIIGHMPLPQTNGFIGDVIGIRVKGDSMEPDIKDGDTVLIKKGIMPENHEVGAFILNDEGLLKRYKRTDRGAIILSSDNKGYEPIVIVEEDNFVIVGKKVGVFNH